MDKVQQVNEKLLIISIFIGFAFGIYLGIGHDNPDLWWTVIKWVLIVSLIMTFIPTVVGAYANLRFYDEFSIWSPIRIFILNAAVIGICVSFGFVFCSILIGNFITAN